jgi:hypothetical protein
MDGLIMLLALIAVFALDALANRNGYESRDDFVQSRAYSSIC